MQLGAQDSASWPNYYIAGARAAQAATLPGKGPFSVDTLGMATAYDLGDMGSPYPPSHVHSRNKTEVGRRLALALLHTQYALQFPASPALINLSTSLNWSPPRLLGVAARSGASDGTLAASFEMDAPAGAPRPGLLLLDTPGCWECCARARDTVQVREADAGAPWVNASLQVANDAGGGATLLLAVPAAPGAYVQLRYAANLWTQCVAVGSANMLPVEPFSVDIGAAAAPAAAAAAAQGARAQVQAQVQGQQRAPGAAAEWTVWKGRRIVRSNCTGAGNACTPPMGCEWAAPALARSGARRLQAATESRV